MVLFFGNPKKKYDIDGRVFTPNNPNSRPIY